MAMSAWSQVSLVLPQCKRPRQCPDCGCSKASTLLETSRRDSKRPVSSFPRTGTTIVRNESKSLRGAAPNLNGHPPKVFKAKLTQADLDALRAILATPELYSMNGVVGDSGSLRHKLVFDLE